MGRPKNVFVLGLNDINRQMLNELPDAGRYRFHTLLEADEVMQRDEIDLTRLLEKAGLLLEGFQPPIDALIGFWDFPVSSMVPILCSRFGLRGPGLEAVVKCEHKYWSRLEQRKSIKEYPPFALVDLDEPRPPPDLRFPMWLKPVKSTSSELAFKVDDRREFDDAVTRIRDGAKRLGRPFDLVLHHLDLPDEIEEAGGTACLAEESVKGHQITVEGYSADGEIHVYGVVDSINYPETPSFLRYRYPSSLPEAVQRRMADVSERVIRQIGLDNATFNIEFFYDPETGDINVLEINPRHSQSHAPLFEFVDGTPNHQCMVRIAVGEHPGMRHRQGEYGVAAKWFTRRFSDGVVRLAPIPEDAERVKREIPGTIVDVFAKPGVRLSDLSLQDSYSYELMRIFIGAADERELMDKYERCLAELPFEIDE